MFWTRFININTFEPRKSHITIILNSYLMLLLFNILVIRNIYIHINVFMPNDFFLSRRVKNVFNIHTHIFFIFCKR